ncbi:hypothetical protein SNEBB_003771 [Seison nebaliae]|nr:hypothetical protein SNEBB_003771 [Seison nebaliae]
MKQKHEIFLELMDNKIKNEYEEDEIREIENEEISFGLFQWLLLIASGMVNASDAIELISISYILPIIQCDFNFQPREKAYSVTYLFIGMMIGGLTWGLLSDIYGRRRMLILSLILNAIFALLSAFPLTYFTFCIFRFFCGIGIGGNIPIIWTYYAEFLPVKHRVNMLSGLASIWFIGAGYVAGMARLILSNSIQISFIKNWRFFMFVCSIPSFLTIIIFLVLPESGIFVTKRYSDKSYETELILRIKEFNESLTFQGKLVAYHQILKLKEFNTKINKSIQYPSLNLNMIIGQVVRLFSKVYRKNVICVIMILWAASFAFYGLWMWLPQLFRKMELNNGHVCPSIQTNSSMVKYMRIPCQIDEEEITDTIYSVFGGIPGNIISCFFVNRFDRRQLLIYSFIITSISTTLFPFVYSSTQGVLIMFIFSTTVATIYNTVASVQTELFPTDLRSTVIGIFNVFIRVSSIISNVLFALFIESYCTLTILTISFMCTVAIVTSYLLPETKNKILT